ncbi:VIT1/CCC1 transporter family protein [Demequina mangrovi]|uniref:Predicted Fe2+/Mn2+ transporter, VIT1/CCC1 family n=1 Tax=Demequina mangrovi TaxID=1043493 RepID=A0A1H7AZX1_9MICO|nr:VIT family protein [Demequina mangrovi]SEJ70808.1 Predicted Fe2+/Mn2+ transporter, VIT1/CCC1 family [Demequina mangrovi]
MTTQTPHPTASFPDEDAVSGRLNALRAGVLGANDGIVSIAALLVGVVAATDNATVILTTALAGIAAGALSMGVGEYVSVSSQRDAEKAQLEREKAWHDHRPEWELDQLARLHMETGMSEATARAAAIEQTAHDPIAAHARAHLGIDPEELVNPWHAAFASLGAFTLGGIFPLLTAVLAPDALKVPLTFGVVIIALAISGTVSARLGHAPRLRAILRNVAGGSLAMAITYGIGSFAGTAL